jgi:hypothetical protein
MRESCIISSNWFIPLEAAVTKNPPKLNFSRTKGSAPPTNKYPESAEIITKKDNLNLVNCM